MTDRKGRRPYALSRNAGEAVATIGRSRRPTKLFSSLYFRITAMRETEGVRS
jgi:hypothetical protein